tara:strand:- start:47 stop:643 length:597 start_codon:yes stop_codon:yes gene_type:complete
MSKKFLSEAQVRRFQGLAGIPALHQEEGTYFGDRDEDSPEGLEAVGEVPELPGEEGLPGEEVLPGEEELEGGDDLGLEPEQKQDLAADIVRAVAQELESALGLPEPIEVEVEDEMGGVEDLGGLEGEPEGLALELPPEEAPEGEEEELALQEGDTKLEEEEEEPLEEGDEEELAEVVDDEAVINEVLRRVVARLSKTQ